MRKFFSVLGLLVIIILTFTIVMLEVLAKGNENNFFNSQIRPQVSKSVFLRNLLNLHSPGDASSDYLNGLRPVIVEIDSMQGLDMPASAIDLLMKNMGNAIGKKATFVLSDTNIPFQDKVSDKDIQAIAGRYKSFQSNSTHAVVYIMYLSQAQDSDSRLGQTYRDDSMVLFDKALRSFSSQNPNAFSDNVESTALHEFGHQLGLQHNTQPGCLMQAQADDFDLFYGNNEGVISDFCDFERNEIAQLKR